MVVGRMLQRRSSSAASYVAGTSVALADAVHSLTAAGSASRDSRGFAGARYVRADRRRVAGYDTARRNP